MSLKHWQTIPLQYTVIIESKTSPFTVCVLIQFIMLQLSAQAVAHEQLQRQMLLERERFPHPHPSLVAQHEEYIR
jgi:hypothetical protein